MARVNIRNIPAPNPKILSRLRKGALVILVLALIFLAWELSRIPWTDLQNHMPGSPLLAGLVLVGLFVAKAILMVIPLNALYITASILFLPGWAIAVSYIGLAIEMSIGFAMGRKWGSGSVRSRIEKYKYSRWLLHLTERHTVMSCFVFRFLPPPADIVNMFLGATRISFLKYFFSSLLGFTPKLLAIILLGEAATSAKPGMFLGVGGLTVALEFIPLIIVYLVNRKKIQNGDAPAENKATDQPGNAQGR